MDIEKPLTSNLALCSSCREILDGRWVKASFTIDPSFPRELYRFHGKISSLRECSAHSGCPMCKVVVTQGQWEDLDHDTQMAFSATRQEDFMCLRIESENACDSSSTSYFTMEKVDENTLNTFIQAALSSNTFSPSSQDFIKTKLSTCMRNHMLCKGAGPGVADFAPTRLIDTHPGGIFPQTNVRLVEIIDGEDKQYVALSHCWGRTQLPRLTSDTRSLLLQGIDISSLPTTFQHAITVVRLLGIRYLWIDSLCIIQDSKEDWEMESSLMTNIYGHAAVNVAASSASDSRGGLFFDRDPKIVQPFAAYSPGGDSLAPGWYVWTDDSRWGRIADQPLNTRGWVLQERLLSTRTIHFTNSEIFWQCLEDLSCESIPLQVQRDRISIPVMQIGDYTDIKIPIAEAQVCGLTTERRKKIIRHWWRLLGQYSACRLTMDSDKLVAISGIVDYLETLTGDECLAGHWRSKMPANLLWTIDWGSGGSGPVRQPDAEYMETLRFRPERWRAPSWSWASHNLPIRFGYHGDDPVCYADIVEATVARKSNGALDSSSLVIKCPVITLEIDVPAEAERTSIISGWCEGTILSVGEGIWADMDIDTDDPTQSLPQVLYAALILGGLSSFYFILLTPSDHSGGDGVIFRRVGTVKVPEASFHPRGSDEESGNEDEEDEQVEWGNSMKCIRIE